MDPNTQVIIKVGDLVAIHNNLMQVNASGESMMVIADTVRGIRELLQNPTIFTPATEEKPTEQEVTE